MVICNMLTFGKMFLTGVALKMHQAYFKNLRDICALYKKGLPFTKNNLPFTKKHITIFLKHITICD